MKLVRCESSENLVYFAHAASHFSIEVVFDEVISSGWGKKYLESLFAMTAHRLPSSSCMLKSAISSSGVSGDELAVFASLCVYLNGLVVTWRGIVFNCRDSRGYQS